MSKKKNEKKYRLIVTAHPDDETLFMGGLIMTEKSLPWKVICVTDGNADGQGVKRKKQFLKACREMGVKEVEMWTFPDQFAMRLDVDKLMRQLSLLPLPKEVFTHGIIGEYGHPHHQDVSWAVHQCFLKICPVMSVAYNSLPEKIVKLSKAVFIKKNRILSHIYGSETRRFSHLIPTTFVEGFMRVGIKEVEAVYKFLVDGKKPRNSAIQVYQGHWHQFSHRFSQPIAREF